jgi:thymidylate synthase
MRLLTMATSHPQGFEVLCGKLDEMFFDAPLANRGEWQAQKTDAMATRELNHVVLELPIPETESATAEMVTPNLPWAEEHFLERVGRDPVNPPSSAERWPFAQRAHKDHVDKRGKFSHTYPERFWPREAGRPQGPYSYEGLGGNQGIRYELGDLDTMVEVLVANPWSRQIYLPVWFPEDGTAASKGERVPCTIGYHFLLTPDGVDCTYHIRSCDYMRHFRDDVYMAMRLAQWVCMEYNKYRPSPRLVPGRLYMHIGNFHTFLGDDPVLEQRIRESGAPIEIQGGH